MQTLRGPSPLSDGASHQPVTVQEDSASEQLSNPGVTSSDAFLGRTTQGVTSSAGVTGNGTKWRAYAPKGDSS